MKLLYIGLFLRYSEAVLTARADTLALPARRFVRQYRPTIKSPDLLVILVALAAVLTVIGLTAEQLKFEREQTAHSVLRENQFRVRSFEQYVLRTLEVADVAARHVEQVVRQTPRQALKVALDADQTLRAPMFTTMVLHIEGSSLITARSAIGVTSEIHARLKEAARHSAGRVRVTGPLAVAGAPPQVAVVRNLPSYKNGYVAIFIDPRRFTQFADDIPFAEQDLISLIGLDGRTRARRTGDKFSTGELIAGLAMQRQLAAPNGSYVGPSVLDGIPRYFSHRRLSRFDLFVTSGVPSTLVGERVAQRRSVQLAIMMAAILAILGASVVLLAFIERGRRHIDRLKMSNRRLIEAQKVGLMGDWDYYPARDQFYWSENLRRMYGRESHADVSSLSEWQRYTGAGGLTRMRCEFRRITEYGERAVWQMEATLGSGEKSCRRFVAAPIFADGQIVGIHGTDQDISKEVKLRLLEDRLVELARLDSMRALAATFAHELNQPLAAAANYLAAAARSLAQGDSSPSKVNKYLGLAKDQIHHMGQIVSGARELVSHSGSSIQEVSIPGILDELVVLLKGTEDARGVLLQRQVSKDLAPIRANVAQLKQVLFNLSRNAIEAVPLNRTPAITHSVGCNPDGLVQFEVSDNGAGFVMSDNDPFATLSTTKPGGLGLGLSLARTIVEAHGGRIWIKQSGPSGSTVAFTLQSPSHI